MIQNPKNLYAGNAVLFNSTPYTNFAINQLAQKQAANDALDKYFADQNSKLNPEGLAPEDAQALLAERTNLQNDYRKNQDAIHKHDPAALANVYGHLNNMQGIIADAKYKSGQSKAIQTMRFNPNSSGLVTSQAMQDITNATAPVRKIDPKTNQVTRNDYDPVSNPTGYKGMDLSQNIFNPKPYNANEKQVLSDKYWKSIPPDSYKTVTVPLIGADGQPSKTQSMQQQVGVLSDATAKNAYKGLIALHDQDPRLQQTIDQGHPFDEMKPENEDYFNNLNAVNKKFTGKDITTNGELYAAEEYLTHNNPHVTVPKPVVNQDAKMQQQLANQEIMQRRRNQDAINRQFNSENLREKYKNHVDNNDAASAENTLSQFNNNTYNAGTTKLAGADVSHITVDGKDYTGRVVQIPGSLQGYYQTPQTDANGKPMVDGNGKPVMKGADAYYMTDDKQNIIPLFIQKDKDGLPVKTQSGGVYLQPESRPISIQNYNVDLGKELLSKNKVGAQVVNSVPPSTPATPHPSRKPVYNASYYNNEKNVISQKGNTFTYKDGTSWQYKNGKFVKIK